MKFPCAEQLGSECSARNAAMDRKMFRAERKISSPSTPLINSGEQNTSTVVFWYFSSSVKFVSAFILSVHPLMIPRFGNVFQRLPFAFKCKS